MPSDIRQKRKYKVGIIGAGCAGLFTGLVFDHLKDVYGLDVEYEILESNDNKRLGGRLYTHYFNDPEKNPHDYYDVGAMRFPDTDVMSRVFSLFNVLHMGEKASTKDAKPGDLVQYYLAGKNTTELYNDELVALPDGKSDSTAQTFGVTGLPDKQAKQKPGDIIEPLIKIFKEKLVKDPKEGWQYLLNYGDKFSVRQYFQQSLDFNTTEWLETYSYGTSWYDEALSEMILEDLNFSGDHEWYCVMGGSQELAKRMYAKVENNKANRVHFGKKVTKVDRLVTPFQDSQSEGQYEPPSLSVEVADEEKPRVYNAVFNSAPLGNMQRMNLRGLNLNWGTKQAIRSLGYGASCKVGIRFKKLWWIEHKKIWQGGVSKTDQPLRTCVYPSYNIDDPIDQPGVLLASYTWSQEAQRIGTLINQKTSNGEDDKEVAKAEKELKALLIDNLAQLHSSNKAEYDRIKTIIEENYDTHFSYDWYADPGTTGAFAYFGPGQFQNMYPYIIRNDGTHIIIGEAASAHHAWVVGALESAVRGVYQFLYHLSHDPKVSEVLQAYNHDEVEAPYGPLPPQFSRTEDVKPLLPGGTKEEKGEEELKYGSATGEWLRQGVLAEEIRLEQGRDRLDPARVEREQVKEFLGVE